MHNRPTRKVAAAPSLYNILARSIKQNVCVCVEQNFHRKDLQMMKIFRHKVQSQRQ